MRATFATSIIFTACAFGIPHPVKRDDNVWESPDGGNANVEFGDNSIDFGDYDPRGALDRIVKECGSLSCKPEEPIELTMLWVSSTHFGSEKTLEMSVEGQFAEDGKRGSKQHLVDMARAMMETLIDEHKINKESRDWTEPCTPTSTGGGCLSQEIQTSDQWKSMDHINVQTKDDDGELSYFLNIGWKFADEETGEAGFCGAAGGVGTTLASAVSNLAGIVVSLAAVACTAVV